MTKERLFQKLVKLSWFGLLMGSGDEVDSKHVIVIAPEKETNKSKHLTISCKLMVKFTKCQQDGFAYWMSLFRLPSRTISGPARQRLLTQCFGDVGSVSGNGGVNTNNHR